MNEEMYSHIHQVEDQHWWYVARRKIIFDWALRLLDAYGDKHTPILDVGCGTGYNLDYLAQRGYTNVVGLDLSPSALEFCSSRDLPALVCADGTLPPFRAESFSLVMALDMIEHVEDDRHALAELARILKPGGSLIMFTPALQFLWSLQDEVSHHFRRYTARDLHQKTTDAGFRIEKLTYANTLLFPVVWAGRTALRLRKNEADVTSENDLHPGWSNGLLQTVFASERHLLRHLDMPVGVSLLCVAKKP